MTVKVRVITIDLTAISSLIDDKVVELKSFTEEVAVEDMTDGECSSALEYYAGDVGDNNRYCHIGNDIMIFGGEEIMVQYILLP